MNEHEIVVSEEMDEYAIVFFEALLPVAVVTFSAARLAEIGAALGKRHPNQATTLQLTRQNFRQIMADDEKFAALDVTVYREPAGDTPEPRRRQRLKVPDNTTLPLFVYGFLRPGAPAHEQLRQFRPAAVAAVIQGALYIRDGLPLLDQSHPGQVEGDLLSFAPEEAPAAYERVCRFEPVEHYQWRQVQVDAEGRVAAWTLVGVRPREGSSKADEGRWDASNDPVFREGLDAVARVIKDAGAEREFSAPVRDELDRLFQLHMGYLLLWTGLERYASLRYGVVKDVEKRIKALSREPALRTALSDALVGNQLSDTVYDGDSRPVPLAGPEGPSLAYFREVRHHLVHRGKGLPDANRLRICLMVLHSAFLRFLADQRLRD